MIVKLCCFFAEDKAEASIEIPLENSEGNWSQGDSIWELAWRIPIQTCDQFDKLQLPQM